MHYDNPIIRKTVPLTLGLVGTSNPVFLVLGTLSKYSHKNNLAVTLNAIFTMGLVRARMNNARLTQMLCQLANTKSRLSLHRPYRTRSGTYSQRNHWTQLFLLGSEYQTPVLFGTIR
jgi:hypothetical protein